MSGPASELAKVKPHMDSRLTVKYVELDSGALQLNAFPKGCTDSHITILPEFVIPAGKIDEFKVGFAGDSMYCREGYKTAEDCAKHGADVKEMIEEPMKAVGAGNFKLNVVGPAAELEKLKPKLAPRGAIFWELDSG